MQKQITDIELAKIVPSETNPRTEFDAKSIKELASSIKENGLKSPILVRKVKGKYEIVDGERRYRAHKELKLKKIACIVDEMDEKETRTVQLITMIHKEGISPLDESKYMLNMQEELGLSRAQIAQRIGKPAEYVAKRMQLNALIPDFKEKLSKGLMNLPQAVMLCRLSEKAQQEIAKRTFFPMSLDTLKGMVQERLLNLNKAPFKVKDADLVPEAGSCIECPKRSGKDKDLFSDVSGDNICPAPECYKSKLFAHIFRELEKDPDLVCLGDYGDNRPFNGRRVIMPWECDSAKKTDKKAVRGIYVSGDNAGRIEFVTIRKKEEDEENAAKPLTEKEREKEKAKKELEKLNADIRERQNRSFCYMVVDALMETIDKKAVNPEIINTLLSADPDDFNNFFNLEELQEKILPDEPAEIRQEKFLKYIDPLTTEEKIILLNKAYFLEKVSFHSGWEIGKEGMKYAEKKGIDVAGLRKQARELYPLLKKLPKAADDEQEVSPIAEDDTTEDSEE